MDYQERKVKSTSQYTSNYPSEIDNVHLGKPYMQTEVSNYAPPYAVAHPVPSAPIYNPILGVGNNETGFTNPTPSGNNKNAYGVYHASNSPYGDKDRKYY